jgi:hypothetical protein
MNKTAIENYAKRARREFRKLVTDKAHALGIGKKDIAKAVEKGDALIIHGQAFPLTLKRQRDELIAIVRQRGFDHVVDAMAYTLFNRLSALRFMEVHDYLPQRVLSARDGSDIPDILKNAADLVDRLFTDPKERKEIKELKLAGTQDQELYRRLILVQCNALAPAMPFLFEKPQDYSELLMPDNLLHSDSLVRDMVKSIDEADWKEIEIIGWLYQFYISERKEEVIGSVVKKEDIPAATQLFTPSYIVRYLVENSLGRLWLESHPDSSLREKMPYFIENAEEVKGLPTKRFDTPDEIKCMDAASGSGHILVYEFDLLYEMYAECGYPKPEIPALILKNNLYGVDIDERAVQLASFALMMKAREKDAKFLAKGTLPNVIAIQESNGIDPDTIFNMGVRDTSHRSPFDDPNRLFGDQGMLPVSKKLTKQDEREIQWFKAELQPLLELFHDATNYGSLLNVPASLAAKLSGLQARISDVAHTAGLFDQRLCLLLSAIVRQAIILASTFDVCTTNPPYMGNGAMNAELKDYARKYFAGSKMDLFAMFIERNNAFLVAGGYNAMVTMQSWMFLPSFRTLREELLNHFAFLTMAHLGPRAFDAISGEVVQTTSFCLSKRDGRANKAVFFRLVEGRNEAEKNQMLLQRTNMFANWRNGDFLSLPGCTLSYWASLKVKQLCQSHYNVGSLTISDGQTKTGDNARYIRMLWEVAAERVGIDSKWWFHPKGGTYRKWCGNVEHLIDWSPDAREHYRRDRVARILPEYLWKRVGFCWSLISTDGPAAFRIKEANEIFNLAAPTLFPKEERQLYPLLGFVNSRVAEYLLSLFNPTINRNINDVTGLPVVNWPQSSPLVVENMVAISKGDWDDFETAWGFKNLPLLRIGIKRKMLEQSWLAYSVYCTESIKKLQALETENNRLFIGAYDLQDELKPEVPENQITLARADAEKDIKALISYAIGCMMGRFSLNKPGLQFAGGKWDEASFNGAKFRPDPDGILPVLNTAYFEDDPTERLAEFLTINFGKDTLNENLQFIAQTLGMKGNESPRDTIRRYLSEGFFKDHLKTYKKRPIYWLFSSGKERAFQALVYIHRYTPATLARMRTACLHELQNKLNARMHDMQREIDESTNTAQTNRLNRELIRLKRQQAELLTFDEKLNNIASKKIAIDLDDGVKHNYGLFGDLLAEVETVCGKDED